MSSTAISLIADECNHVTYRSESDSSGSYIDESFWRNSPSPEANDEMGEEGKEWYFEVVGEEVDADGDVR